MTRHPNDTQYPYPNDQSPFVIMRYGDGWSIYNRALDQMILQAEGFNPIEFRTTDAAEAAIRMFYRKPRTLRII